MKEKIFKKSLFLSLIAILLMVVISIMIKYEVEGEKDLPIVISKIFLVSTVEGKVNDDLENLWNIDITEANDIYIYIDKTDTTNKEDIIKSIKLENFTLNHAPIKGKIKILRPTGELKELYTYSEQDYLNESITYTGAVIDDMKSLEISNTGGVIGFRVLVDELGKYVSNDDEEITYNGKLLSKLGISEEDINFNLNFDIIITTGKNINYKGTVNLNMPVDNNYDEESYREITDFSNLVFKRI